LPNGQPLRVPQNVGASTARISYSRGKISLSGEYSYKINDPSSRNGYIYRPGEAILFNGSYSEKGFALLLGLKRVDNFSFKSNRSAILSDLDINFIPMLAKQHTYSLMAFYPYATQPTGELGGQIELQKKFKKETFFGGKYGSDISINYSGATGLDTFNYLPKNDSARIGYGLKKYYLGLGDVYFQDFNIEFRHKFSHKFKMMLMYANQVYNKDVVQGKPGEPVIYSIIGMTELSYRISDEHSVRVEMQHLYTKQDHKSWAMGLIEYGAGEHWQIVLQDQYNYGNEHAEERYHFYNASVIYIKSGNRIALGYGKQRAGIFCVGGVCRYVPASNGLTLSVTSSF
ncbi:MAG TPA: DUF6029 family protein, partial [Bacteroidia bacterium]|nr:DUF6029 family protein [Bacteroidia bacterium]